METATKVKYLDKAWVLEELKIEPDDGVEEVNEGIMGMLVVEGLP